MFFPCRLGSAEQCSPAAGLGKSRALWRVSKWFLFPSPCLKHRGFFSNIHSKCLVEFVEVKLTKGRGLSCLNRFLLRLCHPCITFHKGFCSDGSIPALLSTEVSALVSLILCFCLSFSPILVN